jgi:hypothetical protein
VKKKPLQCYIWSTALCGVETRALREVDQKYQESYEMWCWRKMEKIILNDRVRNEEVLHTVKEKSNILHAISGSKAKNELVTSCVGTAF